MATNKVYVGNTLYLVKEDEIRDLFEMYGNVVEVIMKMGFAFVTFEKQEDAKEAVMALDGTELHGRKIKVEMALADQAPDRPRGPLRHPPWSQNHGRRPSRHLFVANIPASAVEADLDVHFNRYGKVVNIKLLPSKYEGSPMSAFVDFEDVESAITAHNAEHLMDDCTMRTDFNHPRGPSGRKDRYGDSRRESERFTESRESSRYEKIGHEDRSGYEYRVDRSSREHHRICTPESPRRNDTYPFGPGDSRRDFPNRLGNPPSLPSRKSYDEAGSCLHEREPRHYDDPQHHEGPNYRREPSRRGEEFRYNGESSHGYGGRPGYARSKYGHAYSQERSAHGRMEQRPVYRRRDERTIGLERTHGSPDDYYRKRESYIRSMSPPRQSRRFDRVKYDSSPPRCADVYGAKRGRDQDYRWNRGDGRREYGQYSERRRFVSPERNRGVLRSRSRSRSGEGYR